MSSIQSEIMLNAVRTPAEGLALLSKLVQVASPEAVFSQPVKEGEYTVITANEISMGLGFGFGGGTGSGPAVVGKGEEKEIKEAAGGGGGGGGGGSAIARPVAVIAIGPKGVRVEPIVDVTKISLAFLTAFGAMFVVLRKMKKAAR